MVFHYYNKLGHRAQAIYRASDRLTEVSLGARVAELRRQVAEVQQLLQQGQRTALRECCQRFADAFTGQLGIAGVSIRILDNRPRKSGCELYGLYEREHPEQGPAQCCIRLWMRTAHHRRIVAFPTFMRTLLHELCHHLDYELYRLPDSLHTEGFFKRESSLYQQLR